MRNLGNVYESLGVPVIVNAKGTSTRVSGGIMRPEVADAMREATQHCVDMADLQGRASEIIAGITGAEAGYVTSGAAAALMLGAAASVAGLDPAKMERLPDVRGMKSEVVVPRSHRTSYDHAVRAAGVSLVEVGISDRRAQAGVRDTEPW
ncbi:MAG: aminotransferase class V-fold PLP-dependent enzyme, partial [Alphaproteobacteria bacterium]